MLYLKALVKEQALVKERDKYLSHAEGEVWLQDGHQGEGEIFVIKYGLDPQGPLVLACIGKEQGKYLSHANRPDRSEDEVWLQNGYQGEEAEWILHHHENGTIAFECGGKKKGMYLSHASGQVKLQHGYPSENELWLSENVDYLTDQQFTAQTCAWQSLEGASPQEFSFFYANEVGVQASSSTNDLHILPGALWNYEIVEYLLSRTSVTTIKVRFGLDRGGINPPKFNLILFGTDDFGEVLTPYYLAPIKSYLSPPSKNGTTNGNVPIALVNRWLEYWQGIGKNEHPGPEKVTCDLFMTHYGFLNGYNYPVKEFYSLLDPSNTSQVPNINIQFVLHKFKPIAEDLKVNQAYTFGLLFFRGGYPLEKSKSTENTQSVSGDDDDGSVYFDLSTPCPRTC